MAVAQYIYAGSGAPVAERRSGTTRAYQFDGMRSTRQLVDSDGNVTDTFGFDLLGNARSRDWRVFSVRGQVARRTAVPAGANAPARFVAHANAATERRDNSGTRLWALTHRPPVRAN